jgi:hypothetical protein
MVSLTNKPTTGHVMLGGGQPMPPVQLDWSGQFSNRFAIAIQSPAAISNSPFNNGSDVVVEVCGNADCWVSVTGITGSTSGTGQGIVADSSVSVGGAGSMFVGSGRFRQFYVPAGNRMACIQNVSSSAGTLSAIPMLLSTT